MAKCEQEQGRVWACLEVDCDHFVRLTYEELIECGTPRCPCCDRDLEYLAFRSRPSPT